MQAHAQGWQQGADPPQSGLQADPDDFATPEEKAADGSWSRPPMGLTNCATAIRRTDEEVQQLAHYALVIEQHYGRPMDIEWGKDGKTASSTSCRRAPKP